MAQELPMRMVWRFALATVLNVVPYAMLMPPVVVRLADGGTPATAVGLYGLLPFAAVLAMMPAAARLHAALGVALTCRLGLAASTLGVAGTAASDGFVLLCLCSIAVGLGASLLWTGTEALIARNAPASRVGRTTGLYQAALGSAFVAGPFLAPVLALDFAEVGRLAVAVALLAWAPVATLPWRRVRTPSDGPSTRLSRLLREAPALAVVAFVGGLFETGLWAAAPVQALALGWAGREAAMLVGAIALGSLLVQVPAGRLADWASPAGTMRAALGLLAASGPALVLAAAHPALVWILAVVWGAAGGALYTLAMIEVGRRHRPGGAGSATALVVGSFTLGAAAGPLLAGLAIDLAPRHGLALLVTAVAAAAAPAVVFRGRPVGAVGTGSAEIGSADIGSADIGSADIGSADRET